MSTKPKLNVLLLKQNLIYNHFTSRVVIVNGIGLSISGLAISIFGVAAFLIESSMESLYFGIWVGLILIVSGFVSIASGKHSYSLTLLNVNFFISIFTTAAIAFVAILATMTIIKEQSSIISFYSSHQFSNDSQETNNWQNSIITMNSLILFISTLSCIFSFINFTLSAKAVFVFYFQKGIRLSQSLQQRDFDLNKRRDRIISWIIQQSDQFQSPSNLNQSSIKSNHKLISNYA